MEGVGRKLVDLDVRVAERLYVPGQPDRSRVSLEVSGNTVATTQVYVSGPMSEFFEPSRRYMMIVEEVVE